MAGPRARFDIDATEVIQFARLAEESKEMLAGAWAEQGGEMLEKTIKEEAQARFGIETAESRMQYPDPSRPTGRYVQSVDTRKVGAMEAVTGPDVPYGMWVEHGSNAPPGTIPSTHVGSAFIGHRPVSRAIRKNERKLDSLLSTLFGKNVTSWVDLAGGVV